MPFSNAQDYPLWVNIASFVAATVVVCAAGTRLTRYLDGIAGHTRLGHAFVGMLFLGGITSLPEVANVISSSIAGNPRLGINNLLGSAAINVLLLAVADGLIGKDAITSVIVKPSTIMMGTLCMLLLITIAAAVTIGDRSVFEVGIGSVILCVMSIGCLAIAAGYDRRAPWMIREEPVMPAEDTPGPDASLAPLIVKSAAAGAAIFVAGYVLSQMGDGLAKQTGMGTGIVGFVLIGVATSMPELSSIIAAIRLRRYEMAFGQVLGTNFINLSLILLADIAFSGGPVLNELGRFEIVSALLGAILIGVFMIGLLEQKNPRVMKMGYDSLLVLVLFGCGIGILAFIQ